LANGFIRCKKINRSRNTKEGGFQLLRAYRALPKNKALIKFLSEEGIKQLLKNRKSVHAG
jgi:preprotein translocase subunit SecA